MFGIFAKLRDRVAQYVSSPGETHKNDQPWYRRRAAILVLCLVMGTLIVGRSVHAEGFLDDAGQKVILVIADLIQIIIFYLGKLLLVLVGILIKVASYNNFVKAQPVQFGWILVRDLTNMFFIVILLVSAFATIIGYPDDFHYAKVLPKLLLMAVLINFSKTLLGLLIDFSQVIMLTFVSAFQQAAGGNFVKALKLDKLTTLDQLHPDPHATAELIAASILGVCMLLISITIIAVILAFLVFRIITLWMLLIISPLAFFATALPSKIGHELGAIGGDFWKKFKQALVSGPIMAFFLWLALAVVQSAPEPFSDIYSVNDASAETKNAVGFATKAGNGGEIAQFIVVVAFLLEGVEYAAGSATKGIVPKSVMKGLGITGETGTDIVKSFLKKAPRNALYAGAAYTGVGAVGALGLNTIAGGAAAAGTGYLLRNPIGAGLGKVHGDLDYRKWDVKGRLGKLGLGASGYLGGVGAETFTKLATSKKTAGQEARAELEKKIGKLGFAERFAYLQKRANSFDVKEATAAQTMLADLAMSSGMQKERSKEFEQEIKKELMPEIVTDLKVKFPGLSDDEIKEKAQAVMKATAEAQAMKERAGFLKTGKSAFESMGLGDKADAIKEAIKKNPALATDYGALGEVLGGTVEDARRHINGITKEAGQSSISALAHMTALGLVDRNTGAFIYTEENKEKWDLLIQGDRGRYFQAMVDRFKGDADGVKAHILAIENPSDENVKNAEKVRFYATKVATKDGNQTVVTEWSKIPDEKTKAQASTVTPWIEDYVPAAPRIPTQIAAAQALPYSSSTARQFVHAGATLAEGFKFGTDPSKKGDFENDAYRRMFADTAVQIADEVDMEPLATGTAYQDLANMDLDALRMNPDDENPARFEFAANVKAETLKKAYQAALTQGQQTAQRRILELMEMTKKEGEQKQKLLKDYNIKVNDLRYVLTDPANPKGITASQALIDSGLAQNANDVLAYATIIENGRMISRDGGYRAVRQSLQTHAEERAKSARVQKYNPRKPTT